MTTDQWLNDAANLLKLHSIDTARLDCLVLLEDALGKDRGWLLAHPEELLTEEVTLRLNEQIQRRCNHEPIAYIRGKSEFYGRQFAVNQHVLEPRPETEDMVDLYKEYVNKGLQNAKDVVVVDLGTGSGCIAITVKLEEPTFKVVGTDVSDGCIKTAKNNASTLGADVEFYKGDLLVPVIAMKPKHLVVLANLPYVPDNYELNDAAKHEPTMAIFGGADGLDYYRQMFGQLREFEKLESLVVFTEALAFQHKALAQVAGKYGFEVCETRGLVMGFRG